MGNNKLISPSSRLLLFAIAGLVLACNSGPDRSVGAENKAKTAVRPVQTEQEVFPPDNFVKDLKSNASDITLVTLTKVDSVFNAIKVFHAKVIKTYKGDLRSGEILKYIGMSELVYAKVPSDTLVVFLTKHQKALPHLTSKVYFSTVEENAAIQPSARLDSLLKQL